MVGLKTHSINLYKELAEDPDYPINYHHGDGGMRLATDTRGRCRATAISASMARGMDVEFELIDAAECRPPPSADRDRRAHGRALGPAGRRYRPRAALPGAGPARTQAGAEVHRHTPVTGLTQRADGSWIVETDKGAIDAEHVVNAGGYRCNEIGAMMGVEHPVASMEHQYFLTEPIAAIADAGHRMPLIRCPISDYYLQPPGEAGVAGGFLRAGLPDLGHRTGSTRTLPWRSARMIWTACCRCAGGGLRPAALRWQKPGSIRSSTARSPIRRTGRRWSAGSPGKRNAFCIIGPARGPRRGRRAWLAAGPADRPWRGGIRHLGARSAPLRAPRRRGVHGAEGGGGLPERVPLPSPARAPARRARPSAPRP